MDDVPRESKEVEREYKSAIADLVNKCNDIELLDLILQLLQKSR